MRQNRRQLVFFVFILAVSLCYFILYQLKLKTVARTDLSAYQLYFRYYTYLARPTLGFAAGAVGGMLVQCWAEKPIYHGVRTLCKAVGSGLLLMYTAALYALLVVHVPKILDIPLFRISISNPNMFGLLGLICSVGFGKDI